MCDLVERHIWALGKGLDQWQGPPDDDDDEEEEEEEEEGEEEDDSSIFVHNRIKNFPQLDLRQRRVYSSRVEGFR